MLTVSEIGVQLDQLSKNVNDLIAHASSMPEPGEVRAVTGATTEPGQENFTGRLEDVARSLALQIRNIRSFVSANADALTAAAEALQNTDGESTTSATQATAFIDDIATASSPTTTPGSKAASAPAASSGAAAATDSSHL